jgi:signal peptidase I
MEPTLRPGDFLVAVRPARVRRGDVVVVAHPGRDLELVKRVAAVPGDESGGEPLAEDHYLLMGDNPSMSTDGRSFGPVASGSIAGVVRFRYWPRPGLVGRRS